MKKILALLLVIVNAHTFVSTAKANDFDGEIKWGNPFPISRASVSPDIIGQDGRFVYVIREIKKKKFIEKYELHNLQLKKGVELELTYNGKDLNLIDQFVFRGTPMLYTQFYNKKAKKTYNFLQVVDKETLLAGTPVPVGEIRFKESPGIMSKLYTEITGNFSEGSPILISEDNELVYVYQSIADYSNYKKGDQITPVYRGKLLNHDLEVLEDIEYQLPYDNFLITDSKLGNNGLVYMAGFQYETKEDESKRLIKRSYTDYGNLEILVLDLETSEIEVLEVELDRDIEGFSFKVNDDESIVVSGLTGEGAGATGSFYIKYNPDFSEKAQTQVDFEDDFITSGWSEKSKAKLEKKQEKEERKGEKKTQPELYRYSVRDLLVKPDGSAVLLAEQYYVDVVTTSYVTASGQTRYRTTRYYYYNDIIAVNYTENGDLDWKTVIDKYQVSTDDGGYYSSFFTVQQENDISVIFNNRAYDLEDTEGLSKVEQNKLKRKIVGTRVVLDEEGGTTMSKMFEFEENGLKIVPKVCEQVSGDLVFLYARARKGDQIGTIEF